MWGQPLALAIVAAAALYMEDALIAIYLMATLGSLLLSFALGHAALVTKALQGMTGMALACTAVLHFWKWSGLATDPASWWIDAGLLITAAVFVVLAARTAQAIKKAEYS